MSSRRGNSPRYRAILMLMYGSGLRTGEAVSLRPQDLEPERGYSVRRFQAGLGVVRGKRTRPCR